MMRAEKTGIFAGGKQHHRKRQSSEAQDLVALPYELAAGVPGRIKLIHVEAGMLVENVMVESGALAVISLDGYMALDVETDALEEGELVTVIPSFIKKQY